MHNFTWNRFPVKNLLIESLLTPIVESTYLNRDMCKFESSQKGESRWQSTDSSKAYRNTSALKCCFFVICPFRFLFKYFYYYRVFSFRGATGPFWLALAELLSSIFLLCIIKFHETHNQPIVFQQIKVFCHIFTARVALNIVFMWLLFFVIPIFGCKDII